MDPSQLPEMLTTNEVAALLRVHPKHVYRLRKRGLPARRFGSEWRYTREEVLRWSQGDASVATVKPEPQVSSATAPPLIAANGDFAIDMLLRRVNSSGPPYLGLVVTDHEGGLRLLRERAVLAAGCHGHAPPTRVGSARIARIPLTLRQVGFIAKDPNVPLTWGSVRRLHSAIRPPSAGMHRYIDRYLEYWKVPKAKFLANAVEFQTHAEVAFAVVRGECKIGIASRAWAHRLGLRFRRFATESYGLLVMASTLGDPRVIRLCEVAQSGAYRASLVRASGHDPMGSGSVCYDVELPDDIT